MPSGRLVCRCHDVFLWCYVYFVLLRFRLYVFVEAAALRSIVLRYAGARITARFFVLVLERCRFFRVFFAPFPLSLCMESTSYVLSFRMVFFYLVATGWIFDISLCENSVNQSGGVLRMSQRAFTESFSSRYGVNTVSGLPASQSADLGPSRKGEPVCDKSVRAAVGSLIWVSGI